MIRLGKGFQTRNSHKLHTEETNSLQGQILGLERTNKLRYTARFPCHALAVFIGLVFLFH